MSADFLQVGHHRLPMRQVSTVDGWFEVPRYVYRTSNDRAWWVCINRQEEDRFHRYFADCDYGSIQQSLTMAVERLYDELPNRKSFEQLNPGSSLWYMVREVPDRKTGLLREWVQTCVCGYHGRLRTVCFWVGTPNTRSDKKLRLAIDQAIGTRAWAIEMIKAEGRDVLFQAPVPKNVERFAC